MGLFNKKVCDFCGEKIGLLGNNKLKDANMCDECLKPASRWIRLDKYDKERMEKHLEYRKRNKKKVQAFEATQVVGIYDKVYIDETAGLFLVSKARNFKKHNPDVMELSQVIGCNIDVDEEKSEMMRTNRDGERVSCNPPRYEYRSKVTLVLEVQNRWFKRMRLKVSDGHLDSSSPEYENAYKTAQEMKNALMSAKEEKREADAEAAKPKAAVQCPYCGATTTPDEKGCCEYCGGAIG